MSKKSLIATILAIVMMFSVMSVSAFAADNDAAIPVINGNTITVSEPAELKWLSDYSNSSTDYENIPHTFAGYTINITKDIAYNESTWTPIADFRGTMTGNTANDNGYVTISGLHANVSGDGAGFCAKTSGGAVFNNIKIADSSFYASGRYAGAFIGNGFVSTYTNCYAENVTVSGTRFVGGITGTTYGNVTNCSVTGNTTVTARGTSLIINGDNAGGIVGLVGENATRISGCTIDGITVTAARQAGGIAGAVQYGNFIINNTVKNSTINSVGTGTALWSDATPCAGGVIGQLAAASDNESITVTGNIVENITVTQAKSGTQYIGWLIGDANTRLNSSQYVISGNTHNNVTGIKDTTTVTLNEVGFSAANPSEAN